MYLIAGLFLDIDWCILNCWIAVPLNYLHDPVAVCFVRFSRNVNVVIYASSRGPGKGPGNKRTRQ